MSFLAFFVFIVFIAFIVCVQHVFLCCLNGVINDDGMLERLARVQTRQSSG